MIQQSPCSTCLDRNICHWQLIVSMKRNFPYCLFKTFGDPENQEPDPEANNDPADLTHLTVEAVSCPN